MKKSRRPGHVKASIEQSEVDNGVKQSLHIRQAPLPDPLELEAYKKIDKTFPERIMKMAESEQRFRHIATFVGQANFIILVLAGYGVAAFTGIKGAEWTGFAIAIGVSYVVYAFKSKDPKPPVREKKNVERP